MKRTNLTVLYGTQTGTAREVADRIALTALCMGVEAVSVLEMDDVPLDKWHEHSPLALVCSTTGQGEIPQTMKGTWETLRTVDAPSLERCDFAVFGLGDSSYKKFNFSAKLLHNRLVQLDATPLVHRGLGDDEDAGGYDDELVPWLDELWAALLHPKKEEKEKEEGGASSHQTKTKKPERLFPGEIKDLGPRWEITVTREEDPDSNTATPPSVPRCEDTMRLKTVVNERMTSQDHFQDVRFVEFETTTTTTPCEKKKEETRSSSPFRYAPGDSLAIYPPNSDADVQYMLKRCGLDNDGGKTTTTLKIAPATGGRFAHVCRLPFFQISIPAQWLFRHYLDVSALCTRTFLAALAEWCSDDEERERLDELASPAHAGEYTSYCIREKRSFVEVLQDFPNIHVPLEFLLPHIRPLSPRYFSIASSPLLDGTAKLSLAVAVLTFKTPWGRSREGLCSGYISRLQLGDDIECFISPGNMTLPPSPETPLVLIGTGTGVAPLRSLVRQAMALNWRGNIHLFFGCRFSAKDFHFKKEWEEMTSSSSSSGGGAIRFELHTAFSRDPATVTQGQQGQEPPGPESDNCKYVQHRLVKTAQKVADVILKKGGYVYLCGNSKQMPKDVEKCMVSIVQKHADGMGREEDEAAAQKYVTQMIKAGRYQMDTWSV